MGDFRLKIYICGYFEDLLGCFYVFFNGINFDFELSEEKYERMVYVLYWLYKGLIEVEVKFVFLEIV